MKLLETVLISLSIGCFLLWVLEIRNTGNFGENYWLVMLCLAFLLGFQYVRTVSREKNRKGPTMPLKNPKQRAQKRPILRRKSSKR